MNHVNDSGELFFSHTRIDGVFTLRLSIGNIRQQERHVEDAWHQISTAAKALDLEAS